MSTPDGYVYEINSLKAEIKRLNERTKKLREQKRTAEKHLYKHMHTHKVEKYENITIKSIRPKEKQKRKPEKAKRTDAISLFRDVGIPDPENFWVEFKATQKYINGETDQQTESRPDKKGGYDAFLGF